MKPIPAWSWTLIAIAAVVLTAGVITTWLLIIADHAAAGNRTSAQLDAVRTGLAAGAGAGAAVGLMLAFRRQHHQEIATQNTDFDATERRITELYTKAVEQFGVDKAPVRLGGLYALERLAQDNDAHRQTIVNVICAYLRMPFPATPDSMAAPIPGEEGTSAGTQTAGAPRLAGDTWQQEKHVRLTAQRILSEHLHQPDTSQDPAGTSPTRFWPDIRLDLTGATLIDLNLQDCIVAEAQFGGATFSGAAEFGGATFSGDAWFTGATFSGITGFGEATFSSNAGFGGATFSGDARFDGATFSGMTWFNETTFSGTVWFNGATFSSIAWFNRVWATFSSDTRFGGATFSSAAEFGGATFSGAARFGGATFSGAARFGGATFSGAARFGGATFELGPGALTFQDAVVASAKLPHAWPKEWQLSEASTDTLTITRITSSTTKS